MWRRVLRVNVSVFDRLLVLALGLALYVATLAPSVLWGGGDFARFQVWAATLHLEGGALGHPLWVMLAHPFTWLPVGDHAYRANLSSAVFSAAALVLVWTTIRDLHPSRAGAWLGTLVLGISHTFWTYAVMPKVYALNSLLLALALLLALRWSRSHRPGYLYGLALVFGLGAWSHLLFLVLLVAFVVFLLLDIRRTEIVHGLLAGACFGLLAGTSLLLSGPAEENTGAGELALVFVQHFVAVLASPRSLGLGIAVFVAMLGYQFFATLALVAIGLRHLFYGERRMVILLLLIVMLDMAFVFAWMPTTTRLVDYAQNWHFYLPAFMVTAILAGAGAGSLWARLRPRGRVLLVAMTLLVPVAMYLSVPRVATGVLERFAFRALPGRDMATYLLAPWKQNETGPRSYGEAVLQSLPPDATLLADYSIYWIVRYLMEIEGRRPDIRLVEVPAPPRLDRHLPLALEQAADGRRLFVADTNRYYDVEALEQVFRIVPHGPIFELVR